MNKKSKITFLLIMAMVSGILFCSFSPYETDCEKISHELNGTWQNGPFTLYINEYNYFCKVFNQDYSRGIVVYDGQKVGIVSSYAWNFSQNRWIEYNETVTGEYIYQNNEITLFKITGRYEPLNGTWKKINSNNYFIIPINK